MIVGNLFRTFLCKRFSGRRKCSGGKNVRSDSFGPFSPTSIFAHFCRQNARLHDDFPPFTTQFLIMLFLASSVDHFVGFLFAFFLSLLEHFSQRSGSSRKGKFLWKYSFGIFLEETGLDKEKIVRKGSEKRQIRGKLFESNFATKLFKS